jgi:hypothetical protein
MPKRSWLEKAKSIHDLGDHFYIQKPGEPYDPKRDARADERIKARHGIPVPVAEEFAPFFGSRMHDSAVLGTERTTHEFRVKLSSDSAEVFAYDLSRVLGIAPSRAQWRVDLIFHEPIYVRSARHDANGALRFAPLEELEPANKRYKGHTRATFIADWFFQQEGRIQSVMEFDRDSIGSRGLSNAFFVAVDAVSASAEDRREQAMIKAFGPAAGVLWADATQNGRIWPYGPTPGHVGENQIKAAMTRLNLKASDFLQNASTF